MTSARRAPWSDAAPARPASVITGSTYRISVLTERLFRLEYSPTGVFEDRPSLFAIHRDFPTPTFRTARTNEGLEVTTAGAQLVYDEQPFSPGGLRIEVRGGVTNYHSVWRYGDGAQNPARDLWPDQASAVPREGNLGGTARTLDEADGAIRLEDGVLSKQGYAAIDDSETALFTDDGWYAPRYAPEGSKDLYVFAHGHDAHAALTDFYALSGKQPLLPRWALGNWWSRYYRYDEQGYLSLMDEFAGRGIPLSVSVLDMDWHVTDVPADQGSGWTGYTWNRDFFPDPERFLSELHDRGLTTTLNVHPADGIQPYEDAYPELLAALGRDADSGAIRFDVTDREFLDAYFDVLHHHLEEQGVDFWWLDWQQGPYAALPGIDPLWILNHYHFLDSGREGRRPLTFSRYAGPGSHRYPVGFSGDTIVTWDSLRFQPYFTATASNIGYGWWSHDIGGHMFGYRDDELTARWVQLGTFSPILRLHSTLSSFNEKEPWRFEEPFASAMTDALRLRHRLIPYLYTMNRRAHVEDRPLVEPLYHRDDLPGAYTHPNEYHFGSELLVAPVVDPIDPVLRRARVSAWLPPGHWTDIFTGHRYDGGPADGRGREIDMFRPIDQTPVLLRAGGILPLVAPDLDPRPVGNPSAIELLVAAGASGEFTLAEDDGSGAGDDEAAWAFTPIALDAEAGTLTIGPLTGNAEVVSERRSFTVTVLGAGDLSDLVAESDDGRELTVERGGSAARPSLRLGGVPTGTRVVLRSAGLATTRGSDVSAAVRDFLRPARIGYQLKEAIQRAVEEDPATALGRIPGLDTSFPTSAHHDYARPTEPLIAALAELLSIDRHAV